MRIAMVASESNPLCKTGGLADVVWSLTKELVGLKEEAFVVLPFYKCIKENPTIRFSKVGSYDVFLSWRRQTADVFECEIHGVRFYLIGNDYYFNRENLYSYDDDGERFAFFTLAARSLFPFLNLHVDVIHVHDWQPGMLPTLVKVQSAEEPVFQGTKFVLTLHNEAFKGYLDRYFVNHFYGLSDTLFDEGSIRFDGMLSTLKSAIVYADKVIAVSPSHAEELLNPNDSMRLSQVLKMRGDDFQGILNGVDYEEFNPEEDMFIAANYSASSFEKGKAICRKKLLQTCMLDEEPGPIYGLVSRLTFQKGIELALDVGEELLADGAKLVVLGAGEPELEQRLEELRSRYPTRCAIYRGYNNQLAHDIYAGADFFLMPSLFEPCGLGQMIAQRYGCLPIVRSVGGLKDTVIGFDGLNGDVATGFAFDDYSTMAFRLSCFSAWETFDYPATMRKLVRNAMAMDHSWTSSAKEYLKVYQSL